MHGRERKRFGGLDGTGTVPLFRRFRDGNRIAGPGPAILLSCSSPVTPPVFRAQVPIRFGYNYIVSAP